MFGTDKAFAYSSTKAPRPLGPMRSNPSNPSNTYYSTGLIVSHRFVPRTTETITSSYLTLGYSYTSTSTTNVILCYCAKYEVGGEKGEKQRAGDGFSRPFLSFMKHFIVRLKKGMELLKSYRECEQSGRKHILR